MKDPLITILFSIAILSALTGLVLGALPMSAGVYGWATVLMFIVPTVCFLVGLPALFKE